MRSLLQILYFLYIFLLFNVIMQMLFPYTHFQGLIFEQDYNVRSSAIFVAGRLSEKNPAYVLPALRRHLIQLLTYLEKRYVIYGVVSWDETLGVCMSGSFFPISSDA